MNKVAIVVQRCHESVVGGSEALAWQYATLLKDAYEVDVLSTTATDAAYWTNALPEGLEIKDGINIRRFHVDIGYSPYRTELFERLRQDFTKFGLGRNSANGAMKHLPWSIGLQEELIRRIGPYSSRLVEFVRHNWANYRAVIVVTYLYPTAYFSLLEIPAGRALFAPTLHDEEPAYLSVYKHAALRAHSMIWLTKAEQKLGHDLWGELPGRIVALAIDAEPRQPAQRDAPYMLYCGRIDPHKGCVELFDYFTRFKKENASALRLVLTGKDDIPVPNHADIDFLGFVSAEEKFSLMAGATLYVMPSAKESFSIVTLEAMAQNTPVLVNGASEVLADHLRGSRGGSIYHDYDSFAAELSRMLRDEDLRERMAGAGRDYVVSNFVPERIRPALIDAVESCADVRPPEKRSIAPARTDAAGPTPINLSSSPPLPLPEGWSVAELRELLCSLELEDAPAEEMKNYVNADFKRFVYTLGLVPDRPGLKLLELGANPYFTTALVHKFRDAELQLANFFEKPEREGSQRVTINKTGEVLTLNYKQFNIEEDSFPYDDDSFDVVLFCEILEHLLSDPVHALTEIRRVLKPGGTLVLTTPNVARLENVRKVVAGENIYDPYSGYGPYGRHNREYTPQDVFNLLTENGFNVGKLFTADVNPDAAALDEEVVLLVKHRQPDLGQYIFCQSNVNLESKRLPAVRPDWLYRSMHQKSNASG